jgi:hypothetical protein
MRQTIIADSTKISTFDECPEKYKLSYVENLTPSNVIDEDIAAGAYGHKLLEIYYKEKHHGVQYAIDKCNHFTQHLRDKEFPLSTETSKKVEDRFKFYWMRYAQDDYTTLTHLVKTIKVDSDGLPFTAECPEPLVEQGFSYKLLDTKEYLFVLEGRIDWIAKTQGMNLWIDHKFQFRERNLYTRSIQFKNYALATGLNVGIINYIRLHEKIKESTLDRRTVSFSPLDMKCWRENLIEIFIQMAKAAKNGYEHRWNSCAGKFGYPCQFTNICEEHNLVTINAIKNTQYEKRKEWKPW